MYNPISTYRIQFHKDFQFKDLNNLTDYFDKLGVGTIYASPVFEAVKGSLHGYDGINPQNINPEIGKKAELEHLCSKLREHNIGWLQDIVPNHMAYDTSNIWLSDVLEKGRFSPFARYFDIHWDQGTALMTPFLGTDTGTAIKDGIIKVIIENGRFYFDVNEQKYPLSPNSYVKILGFNESSMPQKLRETCQNLPKLTGNESGLLAWDKFVELFAGIINDNMVSDYINFCLKQINKSGKILHELVNEQEYLLCNWQLTHSAINYRRFFTVNSLICLNIQNDEVFDAYHKLILEMTASGVFQGLRIDHVDGLYDPGEYLERLRKNAGNEAYIIVEKILEQNEVIPKEWHVQGATGYNFLSNVNNLFTNNESEKHFTDFYQKISRDKANLNEQVSSRKGLILYQRMAGELDNLYSDFELAAGAGDVDLSVIDKAAIKKAIGELLIQFPVYRFYSRKMPLPLSERKVIDSILGFLSLNSPEMVKAVNILKHVLLDKPGKGNKKFDASALHFYRRMMQITGPLMAKGVEDTLMYSYNRFIGHNEVGDSLEVFGISSKEWHDKMVERMKNHPLTMNTTSTHDTKRGEDVRARLNVLTDLPGLWFQNVMEFQRINAELKTNNCPDQNDEYFVYLTLLGMYPMPGEPADDVAERLKEYIPKALREAKQHSNWTNPDEKYEDHVTNFALALLNKERSFWKLFMSLHRKISDFGILNSLSQLLLKCTVPGLPDIYRGTELWDLSLVDPDNRRRVDYKKRINWLNEITGIPVSQQEKFFRQLWDKRFDGKIKLWLTQKLLQYRKQNQELFLHGKYIPLATGGKYKDNILGYVRQNDDKSIITAAPLHFANICNGDENMILKFDWEDTHLLLIGNISNKWFNILDSGELKCSHKILLNELFEKIPFSFLESNR